MVTVSEVIRKIKQELNREHCSVSCREGHRALCTPTHCSLGSTSRAEAQEVAGPDPKRWPIRHLETDGDR